MSRSRPTNREILESFEDYVRENQVSMVRMEARLDELSSDLSEIKKNQLTSGKVFGWIAISISGTIGTILGLIQAVKS